MKRVPGILCILSLWLIPILAVAEEPTDDPGAILILNQMTAVIGELQSCSFTLNTAQDVEDRDQGYITRFGVSEVYMVGPNKMLVDTKSDLGHRGYWYDGKTIAVYSYNENNYAIVKAPATIMQTVDAVHRDYGVDFPAADFFYPTLTNDLIEQTDRIAYLGVKRIAGRDCFHILATSKTMRIQMWIADDAVKLPVKFSITYYDRENAPQYEATFSDWQLNPILPLAMFDFVPPKHAAEVTLLPKTKK
jgi:hypothetical protein